MDLKGVAEVVGISTTQFCSFPACCSLLWLLVYVSPCGDSLSPAVHVLAEWPPHFQEDPGKGKPLYPFYLARKCQGCEGRADAASQSGDGAVRTLSDILHLLG